MARTAAASQDYDAVDWRAGAAVVVGHEDHGLSEEARRWCRGTVAIPMARGVESLNAAVSGSIILFEAVRQRRNRRAGLTIRAFSPYDYTQKTR